MSGFVSCSKVVLLNWDAANFSAGMPYQITILNKCHNSSVLLFSLVLLSHCGALLFLYTRVGTLIVATIYLQLIQNRYMFRSFTLLHCSHQHCVQPVASDVEVVGYL